MGEFCTTTSIQHVEGSYPTHRMFSYRPPPPASYPGQVDIHSVTSGDLMSPDVQHRDTSSSAHALILISAFTQKSWKGRRLWSSEGSLAPGWLSYLAAISLTAANTQAVSDIRGPMEAVLYILQLSSSSMSSSYIQLCARVLGTLIIFDTYIVLYIYFFITGSVQILLSTTFN